MHNQNQRVLNLPAGYFGMVLGTIGMGFAWRYAGTIWPVTRWPGEILVALAVAIWFLLSVAFLTRAVRFPHSVLAEMRHPVMSSFVSLFPATTLLVAIGFVPWYRPLALGLFSVGVVIQLAYAAWQSAGLWRGKHRLNGLSEFRGDALIGIDHQHVIARGVTLRTLALNTVALRWV